LRRWPPQVKANRHRCAAWGDPGDIDEVAQSFCQAPPGGIERRAEARPPRKIGDDKIADVVTATLESMPLGATHWSRRSMARASGLSVTTVHRIWSAFSLQPQRSKTFKLSTIPCSWRRSATSSVSTSILPAEPWCSSSTRLFEMSN
jgi:hypothetical protein